MSSFQNFVNTELPLRGVVFLSSALGYAGDPNDSLAPAQLSGAPAGSAYVDETAQLFWDKPTSSGWVQRGSGPKFDALLSGRPLQQTIEDLAVTIDPANGVEVDPVETWFVTQEQIDDFLAAESATAFKFIQQLVDALPGRINHDVVLTLTEDRHPGPTTLGPGRAAAHSFEKSFGIGGRIRLVGTEVDTWEEIVASQSVTSFTGSNTPQVTVSGTPYTGLDLRGYFAEITKTNASVQVAVIHDNTANQLSIIDQITATPASVRVVSPSTVLSSYDENDNSPSGLRALVQTLPNQTLVPFALNSQGVYLENLRFDFDFSASGISDVLRVNNGGYLRLDRCMMDYEQNFQDHGDVDDIDFVSIQRGFADFSQVCLRNPVDRDFGRPVSCTDAYTQLFNCYIGPAKFGLRQRSQYGGNQGALLIIQSILDGLRGSEAIKVSQSNFGSYEIFVNGVRNLIKDSPGDGIRLENSRFLRGEWLGSLTQQMDLQDIGGDALVIVDGARLDLDGSPDGINVVSGVDGYSVRFIGKRGELILQGLNAAGGALGDVIFDDGSTSTLANAQSTGPLTEPAGNFLTVES